MGSEGNAPVMRRVLVFPGGTEIGLEINRSLSYCKDIELYSAGADMSNHAPYVFARHSIVPAVTEPGWIEALQRVIADNGIDFIIPGHDDVLLALARASEDLGARVVTSPLRTCEIARSKRATYESLDGAVPTPLLYPSGLEHYPYPVLVKPDIGQGSYGVSVVHDREALEEATSAVRDPLICEYLPGDEFTVDCFSDRERGLLYCEGRRRVRMRNGISMDSYPASDPAFREFALGIGTRLEFHGAWFFQVRRAEDGTLKLLEVAPRIAGTMALHRVQGVNFPLLSIYEQERLHVSVLVNPVEVRIDRALTNRYAHELAYRTVYVDLDDTLIFKGTVNVELVRFLYQCVNRGVRIVVLTRHDRDARETLTGHRLASLPDEIIQLDRQEPKAAHIVGPDAIFIDDSYSERVAVSEAVGIPTFDCSMLEMLFDERS